MLLSKWKIMHFNESDPDIDEPRKQDFDDQAWLVCDVPGDVHSTLLKHGVIEDPYYGTNDVKCQWIHNKVWWYRKEFEFIKSKEDQEKVEIIFEGIDTYAYVYLNEKLIGFSENMFLPLTLDVTNALQDGKNTLALKFVTLKEMTKDKSTKDMWYVFNNQSQWTRKSAMNFGWDWGPKLITIGLWKAAYIKKSRVASLKDVNIKTQEINVRDKTALLEITGDVVRYSDNEALGVNIFFGNTLDPITNIKLDKEKHIAIHLPLEDVRFWWTHDLGEPYLYDVRIELLHEGNIIDTYTTKYGIRDIRVQFFSNAYKSRFTFILNGVELFAKGANWIPAHNFIGAIEDNRYIKQIQMAKEGNMNMLRVWGGGVYEKDIFYNECDRLGILIWQDFMFACSEYPDHDRLFVENVRKEIYHTVRHLRNHPSIAIWVGNNENQQLHEGANVNRDLMGMKLFETYMVEWMRELDSTRLYWPGSAYGGKDPQSQEIGDKHNWEVWHGMSASYKLYARDESRFCSEFGIHSSPVKTTMARNIPNGQLKLGGFELDYRNKDKNPSRMQLLLENHTGLPNDLDQYIDFTMIVQAEALKYAVEHYRRRFPETSGTLIWQLNDCWPGQSWSMIDYYLYPKASFYYAKKFFAPILVSFKEEGQENISVWVTNNSMERYMDTIELGIKSYIGEEIMIENIQVDVEPHKSFKIKSIKHDGMYNPDVIIFQRRWYYAYVKPENKKVPHNEYFFTEFKDTVMPECELNINFKAIENGYEVEIKTDRFARFVKIEYEIDGTELTDNYFNLYPEEVKTVLIKHNEVELKPDMFRIKAINSI